MTTRENDPICVYISGHFLTTALSFLPIVKVLTYRDERKKTPPKPTGLLRPRRLTTILFTTKTTYYDQDASLCNQGDFSREAAAEPNLKGKAARTTIFATKATLQEKLPPNRTSREKQPRRLFATKVTFQETLQPNQLLRNCSTATSQPATTDGRTPSGQTTDLHGLIPVHPTLSQGYRLGVGHKCAATVRNRDISVPPVGSL
jgi:hypothetical protein